MAFSLLATSLEWMRYLLQQSAIHSLHGSQPYFLSGFYSRFFSMSILLGANHAVSVLSVSLLADLGISLVLHMYSFCTAVIWGKMLVIISSVFEYETN
jgi:hypothetical protein